jgi:leucyl-tRNA synthetase
VRRNVNGLPQMIDAQHLPIISRSRKYLPTEDGHFRKRAVWAWDRVNNKMVQRFILRIDELFFLLN